MIEVNLINGEKMRVEGARIHIKGYEKFAFYAVPRISSDFRIIDDLWDVVEESSGLAISGDFSTCKTIDEAAQSAQQILAQHATPDKLATVIKNRLLALSR